MDPRNENHVHNNEPSLDQENLLFMVQSTVGVQSLDKINRILREVELLNDVERLILYLKLPGSEEVPVDPLRSPLNPLGSRSELQQTLAWIRTHLEPDSEVSLPKQDVYEEYLIYCNANGVKHLSTADFGKIMKQAFPGVKPRRLGVRGQSRYCYAGLRKKLKLENPKLPDPDASPENPSRMPVARWATEELDAMDQLSVCAVLGWAGAMFGKKFQTVSALAEHIAVMPENGKQDNMESEPGSVSPNPKPVAPGGRGGKRKCSNVITEARRGRGGKRGRPPNVKQDGRMPSGSESRDGGEQTFAGSSQGYVDPSLLHIKRDVCDSDDHDQDALCSDPLLSDATDPSLQIQHEHMQTSQESATPNHNSPMCIIPHSQVENHTGSTDSDVMMSIGPSSKPGEHHSNASQLSQLRILLENNLTTTEEEVHSSSKHVSFVEDEVPPSPNTRRRAFNFTPISPRQTPVASPFVSPRQTPVHMRPQCGDGVGEQFLSPAGRSRHNSASSLLLQQRARPLSSMAQPYPRSAPMSPLVHNDNRNRGLPPGDPRRRHMSAGIVGVNPRFIGDIPFSDLTMEAHSHIPALLRSQSVPLQQMMCGDPSSTPSTPIGSAPFQFPPSPWLENPGMTPTPVPSECYDFGPDAIDADSLHSIISEVYASGQLEFAESVLDAASGGNISNQTMNPLNGNLQPSDEMRQRNDAPSQCNPDSQTSKFFFL